jgi:hypothetical protein
MKKLRGVSAAVFAHPLRILTQGFMLIAEPRVIRLVQFVVYVCMIFAGVFVLTTPPTSFREVLGTGLVTLFGLFVGGGAVLGAIAVLPGIWWLERAGILALVTGLAIYIIIAFNLGTSLVGTLVCVAFALTFVQRWMEIRKYQLAPKRG